MNTFSFAWFDTVTLVFRNVQTGDLYEVAFPPHHHRAGFIEQGLVSFSCSDCRAGKILYTNAGSSGVNEDKMRRWLSELTGLPTSKIQLEPHQLP